jgi:alpha-glucosidase (family GH31 glycosyl hydrolase)
MDCSNYKFYTNSLGKRMGCNAGNISKRETIEPCVKGDLECFRQQGYFHLIDAPDNEPNINFCKDNRYQDNDERAMGIDNYFPYDNNILLSDELTQKIKFLGEKYFSWNEKLSNGGYIKYDILSDNIAHISFNTRQGSDQIAYAGIMKTISVDPDLKPEKLSNTHIQVVVSVDDPTNSTPMYKALGNQSIQVKDELNNIHIQFDTKNCTFGEVHLYNYDFDQYNFYVYGLGPVSDGNREFSLNWLNRNNGIRCNSAFGNHQVFGIKASHWPVFFIQRFHKQTGESSVYAVFFDHYRKLEYDFSGLVGNGLIKVSSREPEFRYFVITGKTLSQVKRHYMGIIGHPSPIHLKLLGLWIAGFGYRNIEQIKYNIDNLEKNNFPIDGFYLDLYWYGHSFPEDFSVSRKQYRDNICFNDTPGGCVSGNYQQGNTDTIQVTKADQVGIFEWDTKNFPIEQVNELYDKKRYGITLIYEPFYNLNAEDMSQLYQKNLLAKDTYTRFIKPDAVWNNWLGSVIVPDFTQPESGQYWYNSRMKSRMTKGTFLWWNDLGEPEVYNQNAIYNGVGPVIDNKMYALSCYTQHPSVHNYVQLLWTKGVSEAYREDTNQRFNLLTRAGCPGISRYGAYSWTGDTNASAGDLVAHLKNMGTLGLSGQDFICSDAGGFNGDRGVEAQFIYSYWFANCCAVEITVKPHKWFNSQVMTCSPAEWGDIQSNLENIKTRYEWTPFYYSTAYSITKYGHRVGKHFSTPVFMAYSEERLNRDSYAGINYLVNDNVLIPLFVPEATTIQDRVVLLPSNTDWFDLKQQIWVSGQTNLSGQNALLQMLIRDKSIIVTSKLPSDLTQVRVENIFDYPLIVNIYSKNSDLTNVQPFYLYIDDGKSDNIHPMVVRISVQNGTCQFEFSNSKYDLSIDSVNVIGDQGSYPISKTFIYNNFSNLGRDNGNDRIIWLLVLLCLILVIWILRK